jgi:hypothetical protein
MIIECNDPYKPITPAQAIQGELQLPYPLELNYAINNLIRIHMKYGDFGLSAVISEDEINGELVKLLGTHIRLSDSWIPKAIETYVKAGWEIRRGGIIGNFFVFKPTPGKN